MQEIAPSHTLYEKNVYIFTISTTVKTEIKKIKIYSTEHWMHGVHTCKTKWNKGKK